MLKKINVLTTGNIMCIKSALNEDLVVKYNDIT